MVTEQSQPMLHLLVHLYIKDKNACTAQELLHRGDHWFTFPQVEAAGGATFTEGVLSYSHIGLQMWLSWKKQRVAKTNKSFLCPAFPFLSFCILPIWKRSYVHRWEDTKASFLSHLAFTKHSFASSAFFFPIVNVYGKWILIHLNGVTVFPCVICVWYFTNNCLFWERTGRYQCA